MARLLLLTDIFFLIVLSTLAGELTQKHDVVKRSTNVNYTQVMNFWKKHKNDFVLHNEHKEVVLVMGNTGAGKSTVVSALMGRKLTSAMKNGYFVITDEEDKIGTGTSSKTLIPDMMSDKKRNVTYIDCSGFRDNRNVEYEISSVYFQNILMNQIEKIKLVLVINYESLKINGNKNDFDDLFDHIGNFIKNVSMIYDGVALVATKVDNLYGISDKGIATLLNDDQSVLDGIAIFLENKKKTYLNKTENPEKYKIFADLIDILLKKNTTTYTRIALFRQPRGPGLLKDIPKTQNEINIIGNMIVNNLHYVKTKKDDFSFALSQSLKNIIDQIVDDIFRGALIQRLKKMSNETLTYYRQIEKEYSDIGKLQEQITRAYTVLLQLNNIDKPLALFKGFSDAANNLNIPLSLINLDRISEDIKKLYFFTTVSNNNEDIHMLLLKNEVQNITNSVENSKNFYSFLRNLQEQLGLHKSQNLRDDSRIMNIIASCTQLINPTVQNIMGLEHIVKEVGSDEFFERIKTVQLNEFQLKHLKAIFHAFIFKLESSCTSSGQMTVKGYNVKISDVVKINCWAEAKLIQIFALNKIFIDCTLNKTGSVQQLTIIAPTWEVIGGPKIILDGKVGESHKNKKAVTASTSTDGVNGLPGLPGGSGGNFLGFGKKFINLEFLDIHVNGGVGGPGQDGGNGANGIPGEAVPNSFFDVKRDPYDIEKYCRDFHYLYNMEYTGSSSEGGLSSKFYNVKIFGKPAKRPGHGGDGGVGGLGGYPGKVVINGLGKLMNVRTSNHSGSIGLPGQGGYGGEKTSESRQVAFRFTYSQAIHSTSWSVEHSKKTWTDGVEVPSGKNGNSGSNNGSRKLPTNIAMKPFSFPVNSFKDFVRTNLFENIKKSELKSFITELENDNHIKAHYTTLTFVKEFDGLEYQFMKLKNKIDFLEFYNSLLTRIEEYAKSERNFENKKVLNYVYTATLTKIFTLKKKRKGQTVVDLNKYLSTIQTNVKEIHEAQHLQIVKKYENDYKDTLMKKIREAESFIQNKIEPEIDMLYDESDRQMKAIMDEIDENRKSTRSAIVSLEKKKAEVQQMMGLRAMLLPLKLAGTVLSFFGPVGAAVGVAITSATSIADGMLLDTTSGLGQNKIYSLDPNLKLMSRVTEILNNKLKLATEKLQDAQVKMDEYEKELSESSDINKGEKKRNIRTLRTKLHYAISKKTDSHLAKAQKFAEIKEIENELAKFTNSEKDLLEKIGEEKKNVKTLQKEVRYETRLRRINDVQSVLSSVEIVFSFIKRKENDEGIVKNINDQISESIQQLRALEQMENQMLNIVIPDFNQIETTINAIRSSVNGSSHAKLDITKWTVRTSLQDVKSLLQKFTQKMSYELQNNLQRYIEKIDEGFSILIDIYDRIDSYADSVKQAEYMAHIVSPQMTDIHVKDSELSGAMTDLKLIIQSNILLEKYGIALHAFKQHFYPFAAHFWEKFQLPTDMKLNDTNLLRSNVIQKIKYMKNHIAEDEATMGEYSKYIHEKKIFNSTIGSSPFYVWKYDTIKNDIQRLFNGSEILLKADISKGLFYNSIKYNDIGINFKIKNETLSNSLTSVLKNFALTMTMVGSNYYRCGERYHYISFDDDITISYTLNQDEKKNWIDPNKVYTTIRKSHSFLSPYGMWSIKLNNIHKSVSFDRLNVFASETIDLELFGRGYYIEQNSNFNFEVCNEYLNTFYDVETIIKEIE